MKTILILAIASTFYSCDQTPVVEDNRTECEKALTIFKSVSGVDLTLETVPLKRLKRSLYAL